MTLVRFALLAMFLFATGGPSVLAQDDTPAAFFRADRERLQQLQQRAAPPRAVVQRPTHLIRRGAPVRGFAREVSPPSPAGPASVARERPSLETPGSDAGAGAPSEAAPTTPPDQPKQSADTQGAPALPAPVGAPPVAAEKASPPKPGEPSFSVLVLGDSLGTMLGQGLTEAFSDQPSVNILRRARDNTGLVRDDYFDWVKGARDLAASTEKINIAIMMIGSNDRQQLRDGATSYDYRQPRWQQMYGDRVEAVAKIFRDKKIPLVWVGLPVMKNERFSADMESFNEIYQDRAGKAGATFVDTWEAFLDDRGQFAAYGPDVNGQFQKLRAGDGVHFTKPGARKLAHFVESEIRHAIEDARPQTEPVIALVPAEPAAPTPATARPPTAGNAAPIVALPAPAIPLAVVIPIKPEAGPVAALTGPVASPGGVLATRATRAVTTPGSQSALDRALTQGQPLEARPGRADDFSWPRN